MSTPRRYHATLFDHLPAFLFALYFLANGIKGWITGGSPAWMSLLIAFLLLLRAHLAHREWVERGEGRWRIGRPHLPVIEVADEELVKIDAPASFGIRGLVFTMKEGDGATRQVTQRGPGFDAVTLLQDVDAEQPGLLGDNARKALELRAKRAAKRSFLAVGLTALLAGLLVLGFDWSLLHLSSAVAGLQALGLDTVRSSILPMLGYVLPAALWIVVLVVLALHGIRYRRSQPVAGLGSHAMVLLFLFVSLFFLNESRDALMVVLNGYERMYLWLGVLLVLIGLRTLFLPGKIGTSVVLVIMLALLVVRPWTGGVHGITPPETTVDLPGRNMGFAWSEAGFVWAIGEDPETKTATGYTWNPDGSGEVATVLGESDHTDPVRRNGRVLPLAKDRWLLARGRDVLLIRHAGVAEPDTLWRGSEPDASDSERVALVGRLMLSPAKDRVAWIARQNKHDYPWIADLATGQTTPLTGELAEAEPLGWDSDSTVILNVFSLDSVRHKEGRIMWVARYDASHGTYTTLTEGMIPWGDITHDANGRFTLVGARYNPGEAGSTRLFFWNAEEGIDSLTVPADQGWERVHVFGRKSIALPDGGWLFFWSRIDPDHPGAFFTSVVSWSPSVGWTTIAPRMIGLIHDWGRMGDRLRFTNAPLYGLVNQWWTIDLASPETSLRKEAQVISIGFQITSADKGASSIYSPDGTAFFWPRFEVKDPDITDQPNRFGVWLYNEE